MPKLPKAGTSGDDVLHVRDYHRDDGPGLGDACDFGGHSGLHDLCFDLPEPCLQGLAASLGDEHSARTHDWTHYVADPKRELLHSPAHAGSHGRFLQFHFGLG